MFSFCRFLRASGKMCAVAILAGAMAATTQFALAELDDEGDDDHGVVLTFSTVGDSRQDPVTFDPTTAPLTPQDAIWLQNTKAWSRIMRSIQAQKSNLLFFNGDMVMGYGNADVPASTATVNDIVNSDLVKIYRQYAFWRGMVAPLMETGTYVVPVAGNHEVQFKAGGKKALVVNENAWRANMGDLIIDQTRFASLLGGPVEHFNVDNHPPVQASGAKSGADNVDVIGSDQKQLSYSFDFKGSHFAIINTDPVGNDTHAPVNWLKSDLEAARSRGARHYFVFGHKPAYTYFFTGSNPNSPSGFDADPVNQKLFWDMMEEFDATYFCGHEHIFNMVQPRKASGGKAWQVMVGSGGSPFESAHATETPSDRDYAWATVKILEDGQVKINAYGFSDTFGKTHLIKSITLLH